MKVTVCIPVYNVEKYISRCLESVVNQTYKDLEIIVVNDCTPDNSIEIVEKFALNDHRIKIINHDKNKGLMMARKTAYTAATGDYITFCDSDDYLPLKAIETLLTFANKNDIDIVSANHSFIDNNNKCEIIVSTLNYGNDSISIYKSLLKSEMVHNLWAKLYKRSLLQDYKYTTYENFTNGEDAFLFYQIVKNVKKMIHLDASVYYYMQNMESSSQVRLKENAIKNICLTNKKIQDIIIKYPELRGCFRRRVTNVMCSLFAQGYDKDAKLNYYIKEYGLSNYVSFISIMKNCSFGTLLKLIVKRILLHTKRL